MHTALRLHDLLESFSIDHRQRTKCLDSYNILSLHSGEKLRKNKTKLRLLRAAAITEKVASLKGRVYARNTKFVAFMGHYSKGMRQERSMTYAQPNTVLHAA